MKENSRIIMGIGLMILGILAGLYVGIWLCLIGGIVTIIEQIKGPEIQSLTLAWAIARIPLAAFFGWLAAMVLFIPGYVMLTSD